MHKKEHLQSTSKLLDVKDTIAEVKNSTKQKRRPRETPRKQKKRERK